MRVKVRWLIFIASCLGRFVARAASPEIDPTLPTCPRDWKVEIVAKAPALVHPSVVACAPDGRVFVAEDPMDISTPTADLELGRILCLHTNGQLTVFADKLHAVFGMQYLEGKLYVLHNPFFSVFRDDNSVGKDRDELIKSTNPNPWAQDWNDHVPANFKLAMDGYFYVATGDKGLYGAVGKDGRRVDMSSGGVFRIRPDGTGLEIFATGLRNIMDVAINAEDEIFTYDNTDERDWWSRLTHVVDGGYYGYPYDFKPLKPYALPAMADYGGGAATGTLCYNEDALPPEYHGNLFLADFGRRQVMRLRIARDGATYKVVAREEDLLNGPPEFRPVGITLAPDGLSFYVCDWNHADTKDKVQAGRLLKVSYTGKSHATPKPGWYLAAALGKDLEEWRRAGGLGQDFETQKLFNRRSAYESVLRSGFYHPSAAVRLTAQRAFVQLYKMAIFPPMHGDMREEAPNLKTFFKKIVQDRNSPLNSRISALWSLDASLKLDAFSAWHEAMGMPDDTMQFAVVDGDPAEKLQVIRRLGLRQSKGWMPILVERLKDTDAAVRLEAATAIGRIQNQKARTFTAGETPNETVIPKLVEALEEPDRFVRHAIFSALHRIGRADFENWATIAKGLENAKPTVRQGTLLALRETYEEPVVDAFVKFIGNQAQPADSRASALEVLAELHRKLPEWRGEWWSYHPVDKPRAEKTVAWAGTPRVLATLRESLNDPSPLVRGASVDGLRLAKETSAAPRLRESFAKETDPELKQSILRTLAAFKDSAAKELIFATLVDATSKPGLLLEAINAGESLVGEPMIPALVGLLNSRASDTEVVLKSMQVLGALRAKGAVLVLKDVLTRPALPLRLGAVAALAQIGGNGVAEAISQLLMEENLELRRAAVTALGRLRDRAALADLLGAFSREDTKFEATSALAAMSDVRALDAYLFGLASSNGGVRDACHKALRAIAAEALPRIEKRLSDGALTPLVITELQRLYRDLLIAKDSPLLAQVVQQREPAEYLDYALKNSGEAARGRELFDNLQGVACVRCHAGDHQGGDVGPNLASIGLQYGRAQLAESILYPSKVVRDGYRQEIVETKTGDEIAGMVRGETADELIVQDATGTRHRLAKSEIKERRATTLSLMPEGLQLGLSLQEFSDLVSYLESMKSKSRGASSQ
ncbi:MAG: HEAT repeat domain-containing protein [Verrucomicrobia bacterium]|nr:HEAT repeat domain-containing protein [Verrucomicrobiota bacterium]